MMSKKITAATTKQEAIDPASAASTETVQADAVGEATEAQSTVPATQSEAPAQSGTILMSKTVKLDGKLYREGEAIDVSKAVLAKLSALDAIVEAAKA